MIKSIILISSTAFIFAFCSCSSESQNTNHSDTINNLYNDWVESTNAKDIKKWSTFLAPNAVFLPPDTKPLESIKEIKNYYNQLFQDPNFKLECRQLFVEVAKSGDMAWSRGVCEATFSNIESKIEQGSSKWTKVWKRMLDGTWKCQLNTWNYN